MYKIYVYISKIYKEGSVYRHNGLKYNLNCIDYKGSTVRLQEFDSLPS
jgi:hypothetical protein